jgi:hypothetical protein
LKLSSRSGSSGWFHWEDQVPTGSWHISIPLKIGISKRETSWDTGSTVSIVVQVVHCTSIESIFTVILDYGVPDQNSLVRLMVSNLEGTGLNDFYSVLK